ncbi:MAG TPA: hypothetical protein VJ732_07230 [Bryobacteraceae bacterium]|nr:hypothetical protein [Bryobacteraceae bacterium]
MRGLILSIAIGAVCLPVWAADAITSAGSNPDNVNVDQIIHKFAEKETEFAQARNDYTYRQTVKLEELDPSGNPTGGRWDLVEDIIFTPEGKRMEKVVYAPVPSLQNIILTPQDEQDLRNVQPFVMTTAEIPEYEIHYLGREKIDEIGTYAFSVKPKKLEKGKRYFEGEIWVDDRDLQIVKTYGKGVGVRQGDDQYPRFETYRQQIDGKYWFPTYTRADDTLHFKSGENQRIRMIVTYKDYKRYEGRSTIKYGAVVDNNGNATTPPDVPPQKK